MHVQKLLFSRGVLVNKTVDLSRCLVPKCDGLDRS
jgi:hypothetical protein